MSLAFPFIGCPVFDVLSNVLHHSQVAAGGIARFTPTRLCCSQVLSIQNLFCTPHVGKENKHQHFHVSAYAESPTLHLSGLSSPNKSGATDLFPRVWIFY